MLFVDNFNRQFDTELSHHHKTINNIFCKNKTNSYFIAIIKNKNKMENSNKLEISKKTRCIFI